MGQGREGSRYRPDLFLDETDHQKRSPGLRSGHWVCTDYSWIVVAQLIPLQSVQLPLSVDPRPRYWRYCWRKHSYDQAQ